MPRSDGYNGDQDYHVVSRNSNLIVMSDVGWGMEEMAVIAVARLLLWLPFWGPEYMDAAMNVPAQWRP